VTGDGVEDILTGLDRGPSLVKVFDGVTYELVRSFRAFGPSFRGGVQLAFGHFDSPTGSIIAGTSHGAAKVKVFDGATGAETLSLDAFGRRTDGVRVAVGDIDGSPDTEIVATPGPGSAPYVRGFDAKTGEPLYGFLAEDPGYRRGLQVTSGDFDGNRVLDIATAPEGPAAPVVRVWSRSSGHPQVGQFVASDSDRGLVLGTVVREGNQPDWIVAAPASGAPGRVAARAQTRSVGVFDGDGRRIQSLGVAGLGRAGFDASAATDEYALAYDGPKRVHGVGYSPTWPNWSSIKPTGDVTSATSNAITDTNPAKNRPWIADVFKGQRLYVAPKSNPGSGQIYTIASNTSTQITINGTFNPVPNNTYLYAVLTDQLGDTDFYNSAFRAIWETPRYEAADGTKLTDLQVMSRSGFDTIRLYDWDPQRGYVSQTGQVTEHIAFLDAAQANGLKVIVPVSNFFLGDRDAWNTQMPDVNYSFGSAPQAIRDNFEYFIKSITKGGKIHPAVAGIEVGNEIDLDAGGETGQSMTSVVRRTLWWVVNLQQELQKRFNMSPTDPNRIRFTIPVSNADQDAASQAKKSWFQILRNGAQSGDLIPFRGASRNGTRFSAEVKGLETLKGAAWYQAWFFNSYQTFKRGPGLVQLLSQYNAPRGNGGWDNRWPGEAFPVPLLLTELGWSVEEASQESPDAEDRYFQAVTKEQAQMAEDFLRSVNNKRIIGYTIFEFNQEPNKNNHTGGPSSETSRGIFKYYTSKDPNDFRNGQVLSTANTGQTNIPPAPGRFPYQSIQYPVYKLFPIQSKSGQRLIDALKAIITAP
jgi:hypothetical protein